MLLIQSNKHQRTDLVTYIKSKTSFSTGYSLSETCQDDEHVVNQILVFLFSAQAKLV